MHVRFLSAIFLVLTFTTATLAVEPKTQLLWPNGAPGAKGETPNDKPTLTVYLPDESKAVGTAVVICPGGGYGHVAVDSEGKETAEWLNTLGVTAFVLDYRHRGRGYGHPAPMLDAQRAIRTVRAGAAEWKIDPQKIGILGFSAGGHVASTAGTHFDRGDAGAADPIDRISCRPDFMILCYAVITFGEPYAHKGSQNNLLGKDASPELIRSLSNEKQVTSETPPTFLYSTDGDTGVPAENSVQFYLALRRAKVHGELHIYREGKHGIKQTRNLPVAEMWPKECEQWLRSLKLLEKK